MSHDDDFHTSDRAAADAVDDLGPADLREQVRAHYLDVSPSDAFTARMQALQSRRRPPRSRGWAVLGTVAAVGATIALVVAIPRLSADGPPADVPTSTVSSPVETTPSVPEVAVTVAPPVGAATSAPASLTPDPPATSAPSSPVTAESVASSSVATTGQTWQSPTGNVHCTTGGVDLVTCVATAIEFAGPTDCPTGPIALSLPRDDGDRIMTCAPAAPADAPPLAYGESITEQNLICTSAENGMNCTNTATGRSFILSRSGIADTNDDVLTLTPEGLGALRMGMTIDEARAVEPNLIVEHTESCAQTSVGYATLWFNPDGGLALISTEKQVPVRIEDGLAVGDSASKIQELYAGRTRIAGSGSGSWIAVSLDEAAGLEYWIWTDFRGNAINGDDPFTSDATVTSVSLNRDQMCVN